MIERAMHAVNDIHLLTHVPVPRDMPGNPHANRYIPIIPSKRIARIVRRLERDRDAAYAVIADKLVGGV